LTAGPRQGLRVYARFVALRRWAAEGWLLLQGTAAATAAWLIAKSVLDHPEPFFAPVAALIALNTALGERGRNAVRLLQGVIVGIAVGELTLLLLGGSTGSLALATFVAMAVAQAMRGTRIVIAQAAVGAILTIAVGDPHAGLDRLIDALVGAGVALVFSQVLFSPEPVALVRRAETAALTDLARALESTAAALERDDEARAERAMSTLRDLRDRLAELARTREAGPRAARRSALWRSQVEPVVRESEHAGHLDLLHASCLMLTRIAIVTSPEGRRRLARPVRELAGALAGLAADPGDRATRQAAVDGALDAVRPLAGTDAPSEFEVAAALAALRAVALDVMVFAGVDPEEARAAVKAGTGRFDVPTPPLTKRRPFGPSRARPR
jgi:uncharacterized membrane protein YgaE (UPF0421/DUF939 family)